MFRVLRWALVVAGLSVLAACAKYDNALKSTLEYLDGRNASSCFEGDAYVDSAAGVLGGHLKVWTTTGAMTVEACRELLRGPGF